MNVKAIAIATVIGFATIGTQAFANESHIALPSVAVHGNAQIVVLCTNEQLPSRKSVGEVLESNNATHLYNERERLVHIAHRECMRGAVSVAFVRDPASVIPALALAASGAAR